MDNAVKCKVCRILLKINTKSTINDLVKHTNTQKHQNNLTFLSKFGLNFSYTQKNLTDVHLSLVQVFLKNNIPLKVVDSPDVKSLFKENFDFSL